MDDGVADRGGEWRINRSTILVPDQLSTLPLPKFVLFLFPWPQPKNSTRLAGGHLLCIGDFKMEILKTRPFTLQETDVQNAWILYDLNDVIVFSTSIGGHDIVVTVCLSSQFIHNFS